VTEEPTHFEPGAKLFTCTVCQHTVTEEIPVADHDYEAEVTEPTCTEGGYTTYTCACGDSYVGDYVDATGHAWSNWEDVAPGKEERSCDTCGMTEERGKTPVYDVNGDGAVEENDARDLLSMLVGNSEPETLPDLDFDGAFTIYDCVLLMQQIG
jgi:hypothetical protein